MEKYDIVNNKPDLIDYKKYIDPKCRKTIKLMRENLGIHTLFCCQGQNKDEKWTDHSLHAYITAIDSELVSELFTDIAITLNERLGLNDNIEESQSQKKKKENRRAIINKDKYQYGGDVFEEYKKYGLIDRINFHIDTKHKDKEYVSEIWKIIEEVVEKHITKIHKKKLLERIINSYDLEFDEEDKKLINRFLDNIAPIPYLSSYCYFSDYDEGIHVDLQVTDDMKICYFFSFDYPDVEEYNYFSIWIDKECVIMNESVIEELSRKIIDSCNKYFEEDKDEE